MNNRITATIGALMLVVAVALSATAVSASAKTKGTTISEHTTSLGKILVDGKQRTLYLFEKDTKGKSACAGDCAATWVPVLTKGKPKAGGYLKASRLGTTKRAGGAKQVTFKGHPLYRFTGDAGKPDSVKGQGIDAFGGLWHVVSPSGKAITVAAGSSSATGY
jgi:predicted lipoprotein with Yx(FWY)xxD motif